MASSYALQKRVESRIKNSWYAFLSKRMTDLIEVVRKHYGPTTTNFATMDETLIPSKITGFHDLFYLFSCHQANRGVIAQDFDEAAYLWKVITEAKPKKILEIGRWLGGSTTLLCAASSQYGGFVISIDLKAKAPEYARDDLIKRHLSKIGLDNFRLDIGSSFTYDPNDRLDLAFIDGDHSYEGVRKDLENTVKYLNSGADILFHDSCATRSFATKHDEVAKLMGEMKEQRNRFAFVREIGSITHFKFIG